MRIDRLYRYPVKGLTAEALDRVTVQRGGAIPWDRAFALAQGDAPFDPAAPVSSDEVIEVPRQLAKFEGSIAELLQPHATQ